MGIWITPSAAARASAVTPLSSLPRRRQVGRV
jgi:hypothetical protein